MIIGKIEDGIVLDHIKAGRGMELYRILGLDNLDCQVAVSYTHLTLPTILRV